MAHTNKKNLSRREAANRRWTKTHLNRRLRRTISREIVRFDPYEDVSSTRKDILDTREFD